MAGTGLQGRARIFFVRFARTAFFFRPKMGRGPAFDPVGDICGWLGRPGGGTRAYGRVGAPPYLRVGDGD